MLFVNADGAPTLFTPSGWSTLAADSSSAASSFTVFTKVLASGDPGSSLTITFGSAVRCGALMTVHSNVVVATSGATVATAAVTPDSTATNTYTLPFLTAPANATVVGAFLRRRTGVAGAITVPSPYTSPTNGDYANAYAAGANTFGDLGYVNAAAAGVVGGQAGSTAGTSSVGYSCLVVLPNG